MENKEKDNLKVVEFKLDDENGNIAGDLSLISFVSDPAIEMGYQLFNKVKPEIFAQINDEKRLVIGPAMIPNKKILRFDETKNEYFYCYFTEDTVRKCSEIFLKNSNHTKTNFEHGELMSQNQIKDIYVVRSWIVEDPEKDAAVALGFSNLPKGTWMVSFKIENDEFWKFIKEKQLTGFSVEGLFTFSKLKFKEEVGMDSVEIPLDFGFLEDIVLELKKLNSLTDSQRKTLIKTLISNSINLNFYRELDPETDLELNIEELIDDSVLTKDEKFKSIKSIVDFHTFVNVGELSFTDYPKAATDNAKRALKWKEETKNKRGCGTNVGWIRANQLANKEPISYSTVKRMASFTRHEGNARKGTYENGCARIMWDAWGGDEGIAWAIRKIQQIESLIEEENMKKEQERKKRLGI